MLISFDFEAACLRGALPVRRLSFPVPVFAALPLIAVAIRLLAKARETCARETQCRCPLALVAIRVDALPPSGSARRKHL